MASNRTIPKNEPSTLTPAATRRNGQAQKKFSARAAALPKGFTVVTLEELATRKRDTSETAKAFTKAMRLTYKNLHGKKTKNA